jgi:hypothetical protein
VPPSFGGLAVDFLWFGWHRWMFGVEWFPAGRAAWVHRWRLSMGPVSVGWRRM